MKGRKPKPTALKVLQGNPGHRKIDASCEPTPVIGLAAPPGHLDDEAKRYWMAQGAQLVKIGTLAESDAGMFEFLCQAYSRNVRLSEEIAALLKLRRRTSAQDRKLSRLEADRVKNSREFQRYAVEFGIGAASRTRIRVQPNDGQGELELGDRPPTSPLERAMATARTA
jgi:phage terminase small subunit